MHRGLCPSGHACSPSIQIPSAQRPSPPGTSYQLRQRLLFVRLNLLHIPGLLFNRKYAEADLNRTGKDHLEHFPRRGPQLYLKDLYCVIYKTRSIYLP